MAIDPVCGMTVDEKTAPATAVHNGTTYYFCAPGCKRTFEKDPEAALKSGPRGMVPAQMVTMPLRPTSQTVPTASGAEENVAPLTPTLSRQGRGSRFDAPTGKTASLTIPIEGMSCASCVAKIERGLAAVQGVKTASVNLATEKATVEYRPTVTSPVHIEEAIRGLGYTPLVPARAGGFHNPTFSLGGIDTNL